VGKYNPMFFPSLFASYQACLVHVACYICPVTDVRAYLNVLKCTPALLAQAFLRTPFKNAHNGQKIAPTEADAQIRNA